MKFRRALSLALAGMLMAVVSAPAIADDKPAKIAVANFIHIFNELQELKDINQKSLTDRKALAQTEQQKQDEIKNLQAQRNQLNVGSQQYQDKNKEFLQKAIEYRAWTEMQKANLEREQKMQTKMIFEKIQAAVAEIAKQRHIDIVLASQTPDIPEEVDAIPLEQLRAMINQRNVLYASPDQDISNEVIALLDARYREQK